MAGDSRQTAADLAWLARLEQAPWKHGFFAALRRIQTIHRDQPRLGYAVRPRAERIRVGQRPSLAFATSSLASFSRGGDGPTARLETYFFGMLGPNGALPLHLTEHAYERIERSRDRTFARFLDLFQHRMALYFFRAWADAQPVVQFDRPETDRFADYVGSLIGIGAGSLRRRDSMPDEAKLHFAGHFGVQSRHAAGLRAVVGAFLRMPVELEEFVGHWLEVPDDCRFRLGGGAPSSDPGEPPSLGRTTVLGRRMWDRRQTFRLTLGPMHYGDYRRMLPGGDSLKRLAAVVKNYAGLTLRWQTRLVLEGTEIPKLRLGGETRLGWSTWLPTRRRRGDARDLVLSRALENA
jgi:type VI secretion system protein ImpH